MFKVFAQIRKKRRTQQRRATIGGFSTRLAFEAMESRFMLSGTTGADLTTATGETAGASYYFDTVQPVRYVTEPGGYLSFDAYSSGVTTFPNHAGFRANSVLSLDTTTDYVVDFSDVTGDGSWLTEGSDDAGSLFNAGDVNSSGIQPIGYVADHQGSVQPVMPSVSSNFDPQVDRQEGGPILVQSILDGMQGIGGESDVRSLLASDSRSANELRTLTAPTSRKAPVSGELDLAIAFETAGGDPVGLGKSATVSKNELNSTPGGDVLSDPLSQSDSEHSHADQADLADATTRQSVRLASHVAARSDDSDSGEQSVPEINAAALALTFDADAQAFDAYMAAIAIPPDATNRAHEEAFDQLADGGEGAAYSLVGDASRRGLSAIPLLALLTWEHVSARNSRRASKQSAVADKSRAPGPSLPR
jgi:hypothetical protein